MSAAFGDYSPAEPRRSSRTAGRIKVEEEGRYLQGWQTEMRLHSRWRCFGKIKRSRPEKVSVKESPNQDFLKIGDKRLLFDLGPGPWHPGP